MYVPSLGTHSDDAGSRKTKGWIRDKPNAGGEEEVKEEGKLPTPTKPIPT